MENLKGKKFAVFGARGQVGLPLVMRLVENGAGVIALLRHTSQCQEFKDWLKRHITEDFEKVKVMPCDIAHAGPHFVGRAIMTALADDESLGGLVYSVNHYPEGGVTEAVRFPLLEKTSADLREELQMHVEGLHNAILGALPFLRYGAAVVVISSAVTEIPDSQCPPFLHAGLYSAAKAAQDELVKWWRRESVIKDKQIRLQLLKPSAIDTASHDGRFGAPKDKRIPMPSFLDEVVAALTSQEIVTKVIRVQGG